ncbi:von Willebrand factor-like [Acanthaster planci]|uniref:von Willebrand factor-like n=1 Tax=Acanthaster planci TaxID=133434 RepID=A0A8B7ZRM7_ACAPL|nr:von Willebrand factor-like [Acanthaster planci]
MSTDDMCCECRPVQTTVVPTTIRSACTAPYVYRKSCECHVMCSTLGEDCTDVTCKEGCFCPEGMLMNQKDCIPAHQCPCTDVSGAKREFNEMWYQSDCEKCICREDMTINCTKLCTLDCNEGQVLIEPDGSVCCYCEQITTAAPFSTTAIFSTTPSGSPSECIGCFDENSETCHEPDTSWRDDPCTTCECRYKKNEYALTCNQTQCGEELECKEVNYTFVCLMKTQLKS